MSERLAIAALSHRGDGLVSTPAGPVFVPYALPGEVVEVETAESADRRRLLRVINASPERIDAICAHFGACGGCAMQHWQADRYRAWKRGLLLSALAQAGIDAPVGELVDAHGQGRRRATFHARRSADGALRVGFAAQREHQIVAIEQCPVLAPALSSAMVVARALAEALAPVGKPLDVQVTASDGGLDVDVRGSGPLGGARLAELAKLAAKHRVARLTRHGELVIQNAAPTVTMGRARVTLPPGSFLQATGAGEQALASLVLDHAKGAKSVADLFCGVGPFALRLAERARVFAADSNADAVAALKQAASGAQGLKPLEAVARDLFRRPLVAQELKRFDAVVFDPPRQGAEAQARELAKSAVPLMIAVSCSATTFARDAKILIDGGYRLTDVTPVDQFRYSPHVEIVARFER